MRSYFIRKDGMKIPAITTEEMRAVDRRAIEELGPNLFQMMENAGRNVATLALDHLADKVEEAKVLVLAGSGGNGGGGAVAARHLANHGVNVSLLFANPEKLNETVRWQRQVFSASAGKEIGLNQLADEKFDLVIDALIGYGLHSEPVGKARDLIDWVNTQNVFVISLDVPSGIDATTGESYGSMIRPDQTLTLALPKMGLLTAEVGKLFLADIGIPEKVYQGFDYTYQSPFLSDYLIELKR